jgi:predicted GIY-YIG superfamily endonuclease
VPRKPQRQTTIMTPKDLHRRRAVRLLEGPFDLTLDGSVQFTHTREWLVPEQIGIYFIHDLRGVLYIGKTADLRRRFAEHYWICGNELLRLAMRSPVGALLFSWQQSPDEVSCADAERSLISRFQPVCNRLLLNFTSH